MATAEPLAGIPQNEGARDLALSWRRLTRVATAVALITAPALYVWLNQQEGWNWWQSLLGALGLVIVFRGFADLLFRKIIPWPSLFGLESQTLREEDIVGRRRAWFWRFWFKIAILIGIVWVILQFVDISWSAVLAVLPLLIIFPFYFIFNFLILMGPMLWMNISQIKAFEPGDAEWGVKLADVRGQAEAKEDVRRVVSIWQSGEQFERSGGKRERGVLFHGPPGTGKTMLAKAIATGFNSPFVSIPGSGFAATFIGIDAIIVRYLAWKAKRMARKWGGQCIVFIDEIDAVGMRRQALGTGFQPVGMDPLWTTEERRYYGQFGAINPSGDLILETRQWRDNLFEIRGERGAGLNGFQMGMLKLVNYVFPGGMGGMGMGGMALNQLLVVMDGIDNPPFMKRVFTNRLNTLLDAIYIVPRRVRDKSLRLPPPRPRREQIYFVGATNVPIDRLDPALIRPGRMGRHVFFRTPTKHDRADILDLYIGKVSHDPALDTPKRRDEIARITNGYSPAMIEQVTSMALTIAHHSGREAFVWEDLVESITTLESGAAISVDVVPDEARATAVHEAGHAIAGHAYMTESESTRLSIRMRSDGSLGHHQAHAKEERFSRFQSNYFSELVWILGAMAAERVFYNENTNGVGGDVQSATRRAATMVGFSAMGPEPFEVTPRDGETEDDARARVLDRFERIGLQIMNRAGGGPMDPDPVSGILGDPTKRRTAAQILGQAYVVAHILVERNRDAITAVTDELLARKELFGDALVDLLDAQNIVIPKADFDDESLWPSPFFSATGGRQPGPPPGTPQLTPGQAPANGAV